MTAPVVMRMHPPAGTVPSKFCPARPLPTMRRRVGPSACSSLPRSAKPSIAELSCAGTSIGETMSRASTRPSTSRIGFISTAVTRGTSRAMNSCACATGSAFGS